MDKLKKALSGDDDEEQGIVTQVRCINIFVIVVGQFKINCWLWFKFYFERDIYLFTVIFYSISWL